MSTWRLILSTVGILGLVAFLYVACRIHRFSFIRRFGEKHRFLAWVVSFLAVAAAVGLFALINLYALVIALLHLFIAFLLCDLVGFIARKASKRNFGYDVRNIAALLLAAVILGAGWFLAHHVFETDYTFYTDKAVGDGFRIVEIADAHLGITLDGADLAAQMERVQQTQPDVVVIVGDFVDDDTEKEDMLAACQSLGKLETTYGVYFVFGNHDNGYFNYRNFTAAELRGALENNGVTILEDESVLLNDNFYLVGRRDRSSPGRASASDLTEGLDDTKYIIVLDHQPNDYANEAASGADLVLSGHTHGGHIFPAGLIGLATGANDRTYGTEVRGGTTFVVTSGISGWGIPFKTGTISEYVVIDVRSE
ncbi:MAG: metallophosphoesterase [Oscillospiraceae bacterium]|nr:metallophosphoesterase [Oscillospiraceae bacterium]